MMALISLLSKISADLEELRVPWALIGALAVGTYGEARSTRDVDIAIAHSSPDGQDTLIAQLLSRGYGGHALLMHMQPTQRLGDRLSLSDNQGTSLAIDLLCSSSGIEGEVVSRAITLELLPGVPLPVASRADLIAMKVLSRNSSDRIRDDLDLQILISGASAIELETARAACALITSRGFNRHKDLSAEFDTVIERFGSNSGTQKIS